jgi:hypothetical protein
MSNLLLEIDEAMRRERMEKLWKAYGNHLLGFILLVILGTGVYSGWNAWDKSVRTRQTGQLLALMEDKNFPANIKPEEIKLRGPLRGIAIMNAAGTYARQNKTAEALKLYEAAGNDSGIPADLRHLALLMRVRILSADAKSQGNSEDNLADILKPVIGDGNSPWQPYALIEAASFTANRAKDYAQAREYLKEVLEKENLPQTLYSKAQALDQIYATQQSNNQKTNKKTDHKS